MARSKASRKYQLTINNPEMHGLTHDVLRTTIADLKSCVYWCMCDEIGEQETYHTHLYLAFKNGVEFSTLQPRFYGAHFEMARGSHRENRNYIRKEGKWQNDEKHETNLPETFEESGELPPEEDKRQTQSAEIMAMIMDGASNADILRQYPSAMTRLSHIEQARQTILEDKYGDEFRKIDVIYQYGETGVGKTRGVMDKYGYRNVYRVTNYDHPFDQYKGQPVLLFEEFRSSLPIQDMLNYLDGYPLSLPSRYADRAACYTTVYILSNIPLEKQYPHVQESEPVTYHAFLRRIKESEEIICSPNDYSK